MHEASLIHALLEQVETIARTHQAAKIVEIRIGLGPGSAESPEHLREHFARAACGTLAEGARLDIVERQGTAHDPAQGLILEHLEIDT